MHNDSLHNQAIPNILIVDDVPANLQVLGDILEDEGYKVRPVLNGPLALQVAEKEKPDLILLDIMMPGMNGFQVCRSLKENQNLKMVPVIFISALNETDDIVKALSEGGEDYIPKPFKAEEVKARVATHLKLYRQSKELQELNKNLEERVIERTLQQELTNKKLSFHLKELEQFTFITSHDLQEPLLTLTNFTQLVREEYADKLDETGNKYIDFIYNSSVRMKAMVKGLLDYSLLGKERIISLVDCKKVVSAVVSDMDDLITASKAGVSCHQLPELYASETELRLLFQNLLNNAVKFCRKDIDPAIDISAVDQGAEWLFSVEDNGIGIEDKYKEKIFVIFKRLHKREDFQGTGIGLAHCKKIVELHGGDIWMEPNKHGGSTFKFTIPIRNGNS
jgi:signal transduction histidine kinase